MLKFLFRTLVYPMMLIIVKLRQRLRKFLYVSRGNVIGRGAYISPGAYLDRHPPGKIVIGDNCYITRNVVILCHTDTRRGGPAGIWQAAGGQRVFGDVHIGDNVFVGVNSVVMPGVTIGDNVIVGALSLVTRDVPAGKIVAGVPAKVIGETADHISSVTGKPVKMQTVAVKSVAQI